MAQELKLFEKCPQCNGNKIHNGIACNWPGCNGTGFIFKTKFTLDPGIDDVITEALAVLNSRINLLRVYIRNNYNKINDIEDKCDDVLNKCNDIEDKCNDIMEMLKD